MNQFWDQLATLIHETSNRPARLRQGIVDLLGSLPGLTAACLVPLQGSAPDRDLIATSSNHLDQDQIAALLESNPPAGQDASAGQRLDLTIGQRNVGHLLLYGEIPSWLMDDEARLVLALALVEDDLQLRKLVESSRRQLSRLQTDSQRLALKNEHLFREMLNNEDRLRSVSKGLLRVQEDERARISRELHDGLGQALTALKINLDVLAATSSALLAEEDRTRLVETRDLAADAIQEVREISRLLRPRILDELGLAPTLRWYVRSFEKRTGLTVSLTNLLDEQRLDAEIETLIFRVTQESLNNILKHSGSASAEITLVKEENVLRLTIADQGKGFDPADMRGAVATGSGLPGMRDRVNLAGGHLTVASTPGTGTRLTIDIPVTTAE